MIDRILEDQPMGLVQAALSLKRKILVHFAFIVGLFFAVEFTVNGFWPMFL
jgi:hypothetical protein